MNKFLLYLILIVSVDSIYGQGINYQKSFDNALTQAGKSNKPVFILLTPPMDNVPKGVNFASGLDSKSTINFYNKNFVSYRASLMDPGAAKPRFFFHPTVFPCYIFLDVKGQIIYKASGNYSETEKYMDIAKQALKRIAFGRTISHFDQLDKQGKINGKQLREYITLKEELDLFDNAALIDKYVNFLTVKEFDDYNQVLFILKAGPYANGKAYNFSHSNQKIIDSIYKKEPLELRLSLIHI